MSNDIADDMQARAKLKDVGREPFRLFFPVGVLAGLTGVMLWPLYFGKITSMYPGVSHAHVMIYGFFGAFIFGFLGTAMPRMLSAPALGVRNVVMLALVHVGMVSMFVNQKIVWGEGLFLAELVFFLVLMLGRFRKRQDIPPPGFVLVGLAFLCAFGGALIGVLQPWMDEDAASWIGLQRLLSYQGFILLPILGIGPFLLPRFFGMPSGHSFDEMLRPSALWKRKAALALVAGAVVVASFFLEMKGWLRAAHCTRFAATALYLYWEFPFRLAPKFTSALGFSLFLAFGLLLCGFLLIAIFPAFRVSLLHLTLVGGFAVVTFVVATRVIFGHSGNLEKLKAKNRWFVVAIGLMLAGMATRISADFFPKVMVQHYVYGAVLWGVAVLIWCVYVFPKLLVVEEE